LARFRGLTRRKIDILPYKNEPVIVKRIIELLSLVKIPGSLFFVTFQEQLFSHLKNIPIQKILFQKYISSWFNIYISLGYIF